MVTYPLRTHYTSGEGSGKLPPTAVTAPTMPHNMTLMLDGAKRRDSRSQFTNDNISPTSGQS